MIDDVVVQSTTDGLAAGDSSCVDGLTQFTSEDCTAVRARSLLPVKIGATVSEPDLQDIKTYFERPRLIANHVLTAGRGWKFGSIVTRSGLFGPDPTVVAAGWFPEGLARLRGVYAVRFTLKLRLTVIATPYHQGVLALAWQPDKDYQPFNRNMYTCAVTHLSHVRLDLSESSMAELTVPYMHRLEHFPVSSSSAPIGADHLNYGSWSLHSLLGCPDVAGTTRPIVKIYATLHDIELIGYDSMSETGYNLYAQARGPVEKEREEARPLSNLATAASAALRFVARGIPAISSVAGTAAYVTDGIAGALRAWGFSKPPVMHNAMSVMAIKDVGVHHVDLPTETRVLSAFKHSHIPHSPELGGTDVDEMALDYVLGQYSQVAVGSLSHSVVQGQVFWVCPICPAAFWFQGSESNNATICRYAPAASDTSNAFYPTSVFYVSAGFKAWTGGFTFRVTFAKTKFHVGRVAFTFNPSYKDASYEPKYPYNRTGAPTTVTIANDSISGYTTVFDLRDSNSFEFEVPYVHERPASSFWNPIGAVSMHVVDVPICPDTVAPAMTYMVEVKASPGYRPLSLSMLPYVPAVDDINLALVAQAGGASLYKEPDELVVGERFNSIKQLIMVPSTLRYLCSTAGDTIVTLPRWFTRKAFAVAGPTPVNQQFFETWGSYFAHMYRYVKGATQVTMTGCTNSNVTAYQPPITETSDNFNSVTGDVDGTFYLASSALQIPQFSGLNSAASITYPGHAYTRRIPVEMYDNVEYSYTGSVLRMVEPPGGYMGSNCMRSDYANASGVLHVTISAADDAMCAVYQGPVPLCLMGTALRTARLDKQYNSTL